jgi:hypothetical protein
MQEQDVQPVAGTLARQSSRMVGSAQMQQVTARSGLVDAWRHHNPRARQATHYSFNPSSNADNSSSSSQGSRQPGVGQPAAHAATSAGRIDYVFLSEVMVDGGWMQKATQHRRYPSDHRPVIVKLQPPNMPLLGKRRWCFPNSVLTNAGFVSHLQESLTAAVQQQQQQLPRNNPAAEFEQLKDHAVAATTLLQQLQKWQQQAEQRRLRLDVATEYKQHWWRSTAQSQTHILHAEQLLTDLDKQLTPEQPQQCAGPNGDGTITLEEAKAALDSLPRRKVPGGDGLTY